MPPSSTYFAIQGIVGLIIFTVSAPLIYLHKILSKNLLKSDESLDLRGKVVIITGSNTGIGKQTAIQVTKLGATCILACRDHDKGTLAEKDINKILSEIKNTEYPFAAFGKAIYISFDGSCLQSVYKFAQIIIEKFPQVDILINNAGLNSSSTTSDGLNSCFQVNYLSHYLLFSLLKPIMSKHARIINVSSVMHHLGDKNFRSSAYNSNNKDSSKLRSYYSDSKLYMNLFTIAINKKFGIDNHSLDSSWDPLVDAMPMQSDRVTGKVSEGSAGMLAISVNPGAVKSDIWRNVKPPISYIYNAFMDVVYLTVNQAARVLVSAATKSVDEVNARKHLRHIDCSTSARAALPYLTPYHVLPPPVSLGTEMLAPFAGEAQWANPSLPEDALTSATDLWSFSGLLCTAALSRKGIAVNLTW